MVEADEAYRGQVAECPHCGKGIVIPREKPKVQVERKRSLVNTQGQSHSTGGSITASHKLVADPPTAISNKWVWCLAITPLVAYWILCILVDSFVGLLAAWILNIIFVILDFKEVDRSGQNVSKALYLWGLFFVPGYLFYRAAKYSKSYVPAITWCVLLVLPIIAIMLLGNMVPLIVEQQSIQKSTDRQFEESDFRPIKNSAGEYDWQSMCQREWPNAFPEIQKAFSVFGGFQLAQQPVDGFKLKDCYINQVLSMVQEDVPLQKRYRYFQKADLTFVHGALVGFTLKAHFEKKYSKASVDREYKALQEDIIEKLKCLNMPELGIVFEKDPNPHLKGLWRVVYGLPSKPSMHKLVGAIYTMYSLEQDYDNGYNLILSVNAHGNSSHDNVYSVGLPCEGLIKFVELVTRKEAYEAGEELEGFDKKQQSSDDNTKEHQSRNQVPESTDRKTEDVETRSAKAETPVPSPTISEPNGKDSSPNRPDESTDSQSQPEVRQAAERKDEDTDTRSTRTETPAPSPTTSTPNGKESSPDQPDESTDPQSQTAAQPSPHFEAAKKHDWPRLCQKEWNKSFLEIQEAFSVFGGFRFAQPPIDGIEFDSEDIQKDVPLQKQYRYFKKADLEFFNGALVGFTLKAHFAKNYSKASVERECKAFEDDVVKNLSRLKRPGLGIGLGSTFPSHPWHVEYGQSRSPSVHKMVGTIIVSYDLSHDDDGYDLTLSVDAQRGMRQFIELVLEKEADEAGDELEAFDKKQQAKGKDPHRSEASQSPAERTNKTVMIHGFNLYKFGQKYSEARMTAEMWQEGGLAIKPRPINYRKFKTLELGYAIDGKQLCHIKLRAEFPPNADDNQLRTELMNVKSDFERKYGFEMTENGDEATYEDENYVVRIWYQSTTKTVYNTRHVRFRTQRVASTVNIKGLYLLLENKRLMPK